MVQEQIRSSMELVREGVRSKFEACDSHYNDSTRDEPMDYTDGTSGVNAESNLQFLAWACRP